MVQLMSASHNMASGDWKMDTAAGNQHKAPFKIIDQDSPQ